MPDDLQLALNRGSLLPENATPLERDLVEVLGRTTDVPNPLRDLVDPWKAPVEFLPWLAWSWSVDLWDEKWTETRKRSIIANAVQLHRLKGTLDGIKAHLAYVDATVEGVIVPPAKTFSGPSLTRAQREAWLKGLPQIRVWRSYERGTAGFRVFTGGQRFVAHMATRFLVPNDAITRLRRRARWVVNGIETGQRVVEDGSSFIVLINGAEGSRSFCNRVKARSFLLPTDALKRLVTIQPNNAQFWRRPVGPSLTPVTSEPELVADRGVEGLSVYSNRSFLNSRFLLPSTADYRYFERYAVNDGRSVLTKSAAITFMGVGRYGQAAHTAELKVRIRGKRSPYKAGQGVLVPRLKFWLPHDPEPMNKLLRAVVVSKRGTDKVLVDTKSRSGFIAGQVYLAG